MESINGLDVMTKKTKDAKTAFLVLHGYGADNNDLYPISDVIGSDMSMDWYFPNGILQVPIGVSWMGRAWFPVDLERLERAQRTGELRDLKSTRPEGVDKAKESITPLYDSLKQQYDRVIIGGFSQGAMLSCDLAFSHLEKPDALVILSGNLVDERNWKSWLKNCKNIPFFQSHGDADTILPYKGAFELYELLKVQNFSGEMLSFKGGHEIPHHVLKGLKNFLQAQLV